MYTQTHSCIHMPIHTVKCRESMVIEGQLLNMPLRQLSITTTSKKREHGKLRKDVKVRDMNKNNYQTNNFVGD